MGSTDKNAAGRCSRSGCGRGEDYCRSGDSCTLRRFCPARRCDLVGPQGGYETQTHPQLHYFDASAKELALAPEALCERHSASAREISRAVDPVIEYPLWEERPVVLEGAWITPPAARRWTQQYEAVRTVFIHEPKADVVLATMLERKGSQVPSPFTKANSKVCWLFGNWVRKQALTEELPVVGAAPRDTLVERTLAAIRPG